MLLKTPKNATHTPQMCSTLVCGKNSCGGQLKALFERPARRTTKNISGSKLASGSPRGTQYKYMFNLLADDLCVHAESPRSLDRLNKLPTKSQPSVDICIDLTNDLDELLNGVGAMSINGER